MFLGNGDGTFEARADYADGQFARLGIHRGFQRRYSAGSGGGEQDATTPFRCFSATTATSTRRSDTPWATARSAAQTIYPAGSGPTSIAVADYNIDGLPDLAVTDQSDNAVSVLLNLGGGTFGPNFELPVGTTPRFDRDARISTATARPDVAAANNGSNNVSVILNSSNFSPTSSDSALTADGIPGRAIYRHRA